MFNVADSAITVGVILLMATLFFAGQPEESPTMAHQLEQAASRRAVDRAFTTPTPAGWASLLLILGGFFFWAFRTATRNQ